MIQIEFINPIKNAERVVNSINGQSGDVVLEIPSVEGLASVAYVEKRVAEVQLGSKVDLDNYATKEYVDKLILEVPESGVLEPYATKEEVADNHYTKSEVYTKDEAEAKYKAYVQSQLDNIEVDLTGYATETYVQEQIEKIDIPEVDLEPYALKTDIPDVSNFATKEDLANVSVDLTGYATEAYVQEQIPDVSGFQTAEQVQAAISTALGAIGVAEEGIY